MEESIIKKLKFKGIWRSYQKRVLDELSFHLDDHKLNIVAAPSSGKTVLGIEVLLRLSNSAFILAPTITVKNQWKQRIIDNFLSDNSDKDLISTDIKNILDITVSTYQGLYSVYKTREDQEKLISALKERGVKTLILDEAHHLRSEWWETLNFLVEELQNDKFTIVSLTETPPYDLSAAEWQNYNLLCGNVDAEISIPELVKSGDLCPHQDLIYFSDLTNEEKKIVFDFEKNRAEFMDYIHESSDLLFTIITSDFLKSTNNNPEIIFKDPEFTASLISYLLSLDEADMNARILTEFLELAKTQIPQFDYIQAQTLMNGIIGEYSPMFNNTLKFKNKLREYRLINGNRADLTGEIDFKKLFAKSNGKLDSILNITKLEEECLKEDLREVIFLDYVGKGDSDGLNVLSVFEKISSLSVPFSILTGSLVTIPKKLENEFFKFLDFKNINRTKVSTCDYDENNLRIEIYGNLDIVNIITEMFEKGLIKGLIGTAAFLGEGWDSPAVNTLIIASNADSFMLSNQIRGRALKINKNNPSKTSDIWHLVSMSPNLNDSPDLLTVQKRFKTFEGISYRENKIQNGLERLISCDFHKTDILELNSIMSGYAHSRGTLKTAWQRVFSESETSENKMIPMVYDVIESGKTQKLILSKDVPSTYSSLINKISLSRKTYKFNFAEKQFLNVCCSMGLIKENYEKIIDENFRIFGRENALKNTALALTDLLCDLFIIKTPREKIKMTANMKCNTDFYLTISGCSNYERSIFISAFREIFEVNERSIYILRINGRYYGVPECISGDKKNAELFVKKLEPAIGYIELIYTRSLEGRKELLKAMFSPRKSFKIRQSRVWI